MPSLDLPFCQSLGLLSLQLLIHTSVFPGARVPRCYLNVLASSISRKRWRTFMNRPHFCFMSRLTERLFTVTVGTLISSRLWICRAAGMGMWCCPEGRGGLDADQDSGLSRTHSCSMFSRNRRRCRGCCLTRKFSGA